jgi:hypothetical protein
LLILGRAPHSGISQQYDGIAGRLDEGESAMPSKKS